MKDKFRKSGRPTDGTTPGPFARPWLNEPSAPEPAGLPGAVPAEGNFEGLEPFDFRAIPDMRTDTGNVIPIRPAIPDDLDRAFHERPSEEMILFGAEDRIAGAPDDDEASKEPRKPSRWRGIARTFALASVLLVLSPFVVSYPYRRISEAFPELSFDIVAQAASDLRDAIPGLTQSVQARLPRAEWLTTWLEPASTRLQTADPASAPAAAPPAAAPTASGQVEPTTRLELASADALSPERSDAPRVHPDTGVLPSVPELANAGGAGADIVPSAGSDTREAAPVQVVTEAGAPAIPALADAQTTPQPTAASAAPTPIDPSAAPAVAPPSPVDVDGLQPRVPQAPSPSSQASSQAGSQASSQGAPTEAASLPAPRLDAPGSPDFGAQPAEALARQRKEALDGERERADALARELAGLRDAIGAMKAGSTPSWMNAPISPPQQSETPPSPVEPERAARAVPTALPVPEPERVVPPAPPEQVRLDPPKSVPPTPPLTRLPDGAAAARQPEAPRSSVQPMLPQTLAQAPATPTMAPNEQRLIERAEALLKLYDISGARLILERAMTAGSARAAYLLAQTYDPRVLDEWRVVGIKGDPGKAQELYARAQAGGIREAGQRRP